MTTNVTVKMDGIHVCGDPVTFSKHCIRFHLSIIKKSFVDDVFSQ